MKLIRQVAPNLSAPAARSRRVRARAARPVPPGTATTTTLPATELAPHERRPRAICPEDTPVLRLERRAYIVRIRREGA
eukprot:SAG11_NODE_770_length_7257_cov_2.448449_13_plen_79_part_00